MMRQNTQPAEFPSPPPSPPAAAPPPLVHAGIETAPFGWEQSTASRRGGDISGVGTAGITSGGPDLESRGFWPSRLLLIRPQIIVIVADSGAGAIFSNIHPNYQSFYASFPRHHPSPVLWITSGEGSVMAVTAPASPLREMIGRGESRMGLPQRCQSVIMENRFAGSKSLCSVNLTRQLFDDTVRPPSATPHMMAAEAGNQKNELTEVAFKMKRIRLPSPIFTLQTALNEPCKIDCFPLVDRKMVWADHLGRTFLFDAETRQMDIIPKLHQPKLMPLSVFVPNADADNDYDQVAEAFLSW
ncbi:hypothetical protein HU200_008707 [Digitaria exilis]|uniref:Uncharacterized protein n=1 Tax=Digitaria exilis TaxID=1010633 RepID=A0A835KPZ2_9POAL|nr:hypothetical protein HU200_008707 [Digitaria exilis]